MTARVDASATTVHWGYLDSTLRPVATIDSGGVVTISTVSGPPDALPPPPAIVPQVLYDIHSAKTRRMLPGHMCTGPVAVRGAKPGHVLQVDIEDIALHYGWGYTACRPRRGALPHDVAAPHIIHEAITRHRTVAGFAGHRKSAAAVLRRHGKCAATYLGHGVEHPATPVRRQHG